MSENTPKETEKTEQPQGENVTPIAGQTQGCETEVSELTQREREQSAIDAVNGSRHYASRVNMSRYEAQHVMEGMRNAPKWGIVLGLTSFFLLVADLIVATVLLINRIFVGAIVCAALFGGVIITAAIIMIISRSRAMNGDITKAKKIIDGKVKTCFMVGTSTLKSGRSKTVRISGITYRVLINADGEEYAAFSRRFYETDEEITIAVMGKKRAKIVDKNVVFVSRVTL